MLVGLVLAVVVFGALGFEVVAYVCAAVCVCLVGVVGLCFVCWISPYVSCCMVLLRPVAFCLSHCGRFFSFPAGCFVCCVLSVRVLVPVVACSSVKFFVLVYCCCNRFLRVLGVCL